MISKTLIAIGLLGSVGATEEAPTFSEVYEIIENRCANCHGMRGPKRLPMGTEQLAYESLVGVESMSEPGMNRVEPGSPEESFLICKLLEDDTCRKLAARGGMRMPLGGEPLTEKEIQLISDWIAAGAKR